MYPEISVLAFISAALPLVPLFWYLQARNIAAVAIGIWLSIANLIYAIDALVWARDADIKVSAWCDISTNFITGSRIAIPAACLSICIHLERLAAFCQTSTPQAKRRRIIFECLMCFGLPLLYVALHFVVQPRRFDLFHGFGCRPATYPTVATIFLVMVPPLLLTVGTIVCAGAAWRHFLVHGVQFYGKRGSISSLTRNLYIRLVGMALSEAILSAVLIAVVMWGVLSPGLGHIGNMSRNLTQVLVWAPEAITSTDRTVLGVEWSVTVAQSAIFFGLFTSRMEVVRNGLELIRSFLWLSKCPNPSADFEQGCSEQSSPSITVPSLPFTEVDLSLDIQSASTLTPCRQSMDKTFPLTPSPLSRPVVVEDRLKQVVISAIPPDMSTLESPSRASAVASSHSSLASNFDPSRLDFAEDSWPRTPTAIPVHLPCHSLGVGSKPEQFDKQWLAVDMPYPRAKITTHARPRTVEFLDKVAVYEEQRRAIYTSMIRETQ